MYRSFYYYFRAPVERQAVVLDSRIDAAVTRAAPRVWIFFRLRPYALADAGQAAKLFERIEGSYLRQQEFQFYYVALYLYVRRSHP